MNLKRFGFIPWMVFFSFFALPYNRSSIALPSYGCESLGHPDYGYTRNSYAVLAISTEKKPERNEGLFKCQR